MAYKKQAPTEDRTRDPAHSEIVPFRDSALTTELYRNIASRGSFDVYVET